MYYTSWIPSRSGWHLSASSSPKYYRECTMLANFQEFLHEHKKKNIHTNTCPQILRFLGTAPTFALPQAFRFSSVGTLKNPSVFSWKCKWRHFTNAFLCLSNHSQPPRDLWKGGIVHDEMCPCVHGGGHFGHLLWTVDFTYNKNSKVIKLGKCIVNVLRQL